LSCPSSSITFNQWVEYIAERFVTNHGYLDNPTFRGMRRSLMNTFDEIYLLDLHGSTKRKEHAPDGSEDKNVFDIQQGVAIGVFVRRQRQRDGKTAVHHADLWGSRERKYDWLWEHDVSDTKWRTLKPTEPAYLFVPRSETARAEYEAAWSIPAIFGNNGDPDTA
jgi:predicted helicase